MPKSMIFHYPRPIVKGGASGSYVRPALMLEGFQKLGYEVEIVAGYLNERLEAAKRIKDKILEGRTFDFVYSESTNAPFFLLERKRWEKDDSNAFQVFKWVIRKNPFMDFNFLAWLRKQDIPIGLFCRDVHWRFEHYRQHKSWYSYIVRVLLLHYDWRRYLQVVDHLFVPTLAMCEVLPVQWPKSRVSALPPGCEPATGAKKAQVPGEVLNLFYVGGISPPSYDLRPGFTAVGALDDVMWTICCRDQDWKAYQSHYAPVMSPGKIRIVHAQGETLKPYYAAADLFFLVWEPYAYWKYTLSLKIFETLGYGLPIITTAGTVAARFVAQEDTGWVIHSQEELLDLMRQLQANPELIQEKRKHVFDLQIHHTWQARAQLAADVLTNLQL